MRRRRRRRGRSLGNSLMVKYLPYTFKSFDFLTVSNSGASDNISHLKFPSVLTSAVLGLR